LLRRLQLTFARCAYSEESRKWRYDKRDPPDHIGAMNTTKCARTVCKSRSADPKADGWTWIEFDQPPKTGWYCPACRTEIERIMAGHDVTPTVERLH
jgi:hypothetical protein